MYLPRKGLQGGKTMGLMIKLSLKSISAKPLRLLLLVICIIFASFTALLAVDMRNNITSLMNGYKMDMLGSMDILAYNSSSETVEGLEEIAALKKRGWVPRYSMNMIRTLQVMSIPMRQRSKSLRFQIIRLHMR